MRPPFHEAIMANRSMRHGLLACLLLGAACGEGLVAPSELAESGAGSLFTDGGCAECVVDLQLTRWPGPPITETREFAGDPGGTYLLEIDDVESLGANAFVDLNGRRLFGPAAGLHPSVHRVRMPIVLRETNELRVRLTGKPGSTLRIRVLAGTADIGPAGGTISAPMNGTQLRIPAGAFLDTFEVRVQGAIAGEHSYLPLGPTASVSFDFRSVAPRLGTGALEIALPLEAAGIPSDSVDVRALVSQFGPDPLWSRAIRRDGRAIISIPVQGLLELGEQLGASQTTLTLSPVSVDAVVAPSAAWEASDAGASPSAVAGGVECARFPATRRPGWAPGAPLRLSPHSNPESRSAIVLVHGWDPDVLNCADFERRQLPGEEYFDALLAPLTTRFGESHRIYVFTYPTFNDFEHSGELLSSAVRSLEGVDHVVFVGHSMGGLVSRAAVADLHAPASRAVPAGIVTLGTPHLGALRSVVIFATFSSDKLTSGSASLTRGLSHTESTPLFAHAGRLEDCQAAEGPPDAVLRIFVLTHGCRFFLALGQPSDGVVPEWSAAPSSYPADRLRTWTGRDHGEMRTGEIRLLAGYDEPYFHSIFADIESIFASIEPPPADWRVTTASVPHGADKSLACRAEFGPGYRIADWNEVVAALQGGTPRTSIMPLGHFWALRGGSAYWSYPRHYIVSSQIHPGYLAHASYGGVAWLGSWYADYPVLCRRSQ